MKMGIKDYAVLCVKWAKMLTVEPYLFFCFFGYILRLVSFQSLLIDRGCRNIQGYADEICDNLNQHKPEKTRSITTGNNLYMGVMLLNSLPAMIVAIFLGPWSDKYTRKYPLILAAGGMMLESICCAIFTPFPQLSPMLFVAASIFAGISGGFIISMSAAFSYLSDVTDERSRPSRFAILEFFSISAIVVGTLSGGLLFDSKKPNYVPVMTIVPCSFACAVLYVIFFLKETKPKVPTVSKCDMLRDLVQLDNLKQSYVTCSRKRPENIRLQIWLLIFISCCQKFTDMGTFAVSFPFTKGMYGWDVTEFSNAAVAFYIVNALVTLIVIPLLSNKFGLREASLGVVGMLSLVSKMILTSVAYQPALFYYAWMSGTLANAAGIAVKSRLSKLVHKEELGRAFSLLGTCESATPLIGSVLFLQIYNASAEIFPGLTFAASAALLIPCTIIFVWMMNLPRISLEEYDRQEEAKNNIKPPENLSTTHITLDEQKLTLETLKDNRPDPARNATEFQELLS